MKIKFKDLREGLCFVNDTGLPRRRIWRVVKLDGAMNVELQILDLTDGEVMFVVYTVRLLRLILQHSHEIDPKTWDKAMKIREMYLNVLNRLIY